MENYIIRIYRRETANPRLLVGTVEEVGLPGKKAFTNLDELWAIINPASGNEIRTACREKGRLAT